MRFKSSFTIPAVVAMSLGLIGPTFPAAGDLLHVPDDFPCIQEAIDAAVDDDEVVVADGEWTGDCNKNLDFQDKAITLRSESGSREACIIDCELAGRFVSFGSGDTANIQSMTVKNGSVEGSGGAAFVFNGSPSFTDCVFEDCDANIGGAIYVLNATATIDGCLFQGNAASLDGGAIYAVGASVALVETVFDGNHAEGQGGGAHVIGGEITISGCSFDGNTAGEGGGLQIHENSKLICTDSSFTANITECGGAGILASLVDPASLISGCQFTNNQAASNCAGGGFASVQNFPEISNCIFEGNVAGAGAGMFFRNFNTTRVENVVFLNNTAGEGGGVLVEQGNSPEFVNCRFLDNTAGYGGGAEILGTSTSPTFVNCLFAGNKAINLGEGPTGGGMDVYKGATPTMVNCTFSDNSSVEFGGAVSVSDDAHLQLVNCVLWDNEAPIGPEIRIGFAGFEGGAVTVSYSDVEGGADGVSIEFGGTLNWGDGNIDRDPLFVDPDGPDDDPNTYEDNDYRLSAGSQAIDAGDNTAVPNDIDTDLDDNPRFVDDPKTKDTGKGDAPIVDMGAYEFQVGAACDWDLDGDGNVGTGDLILLLGSWGDPYGTQDLIELLGNWGPCE